MLQKKSPNVHRFPRSTRTSKRNVVVLLGPTASGKSGLAVQVARKFGGVIISADSRQVYRGLDIGTAKVTKREQRGVPHFLLDVASPRRQYTVARFVRDVQRVLKKLDPNIPIFLVGGSPFFIKAVTEADAFSNVPPDDALRRRLARFSTAKLLTILKRSDPKRAAAIDPANRRRVIRAIEVARTKFSPAKPVLPDMRVLKIGLGVPRKLLYDRIDRRVDQRLQRGMIAEVQKLHRAGLSWKRLDAFGLEYRYIAQYLRGQLTKQEMAARLKGAIHAFARRQLTWWRKEKDIHWITTSAKAERLVRNFLKRKNRT